MRIIYDYELGKQISDLDIDNGNDLTLYLNHLNFPKFYIRSIYTYSEKELSNIFYYNYKYNKIFNYPNNCINLITIFEMRNMQLTKNTFQYFFIHKTKEELIKLIKLRVFL